MKKTVRVVGAVIVDGDGRVLAAQRPYSKEEYKSLKWELPGGKLEEGETPEEAIIREIREELGCEIVVDESLTHVEFEYPDFWLKMDVILCRLKTGSQPQCLEHAALKWIKGDELEQLDWLEADYQLLPVIRKKLLPSSGICKRV